MVYFKTENLRKNSGSGGLTLNKRKIIAGFSISFLLLGLAGFLYMPNKAKSEVHTGIPTVFVHGYKGTVNSFGKMLHRFEKEYNWGKKGVSYYVNADGSLYDVPHGWSKDQPNFIQVVLENNRTSFEESTFYLSNVLHHLKKMYKIDTVNLVGHSMGGIISLKYSMEYQGDAYPSVDKLVTIGSPFAGIFDEDYFLIHQDRGANDLKVNSPALQMLHTAAFPENIQVLSIGSTGDVVAIPESVASLAQIVPAAQLEQVMLENEALGHSALHEDETVDHLIHRFLWQDLLQ